MDPVTTNLVAHQLDLSECTEIRKISNRGAMPGGPDLILPRSNAATHHAHYSLTHAIYWYGTWVHLQVPYLIYRHYAKHSA